MEGLDNVDTTLLSPRDVDDASRSSPKLATSESTQSSSPMSEDVTMRVPSSENVTDMITEVPPMAEALLVFASQTRMIWLSEPETTRLPSGENATDVT
ncbi:hypothetical protein AcV7_000432 [Taiwanofungus camphoratus]|nr:hypothetical protein AcV7_000432 [Antrodia cinnamomea]